jgi:hypothetical protein
MFYETREDRYKRLEAAYKARREQEDSVSSALLKIEMMGLTFPECMVQCPVPDGIHPLRWRAMIQHALKNGIPE